MSFGWGLLHFLGEWGAYNLSFGVGFFSFFNFRLGTYNVPSGSSAKSLTKRPKAGASAKRELLEYERGHLLFSTN